MAMKAVILTTQETEVWNYGEGAEFCALYKQVCEMGCSSLDVALLGRDDDEEPLYSLEWYKPHAHLDVNDRNVFYCLDCGEEVGR